MAKTPIVGYGAKPQQWGFGGESPNNGGSGAKPPTMGVRACATGSKAPTDMMVAYKISAKFIYEPSGSKWVFVHN